MSTKPGLSDAAVAKLLLLALSFCWGLSWSAMRIALDEVSLTVEAGTTLVVCHDRELLDRMDAIAEVREAVDFLRYYAAEGEAVTVTINPRGVVVRELAR